MTSAKAVTMNVKTSTAPTASQKVKSASIMPRVSTAPPPGGGCPPRGRAAGRVRAPLRTVVRLDDDSPREPVLQAAAAVVDQDHEEAGEQRERGERQPDEAQERPTRAQPPSGRRLDADAHRAVARRLAGGRPERH